MDICVFKMCKILYAYTYMYNVYFLISSAIIMPPRRKRLTGFAMHTRNLVSSIDNEGGTSSATDVLIASVEQLRSLTASKLRSHLKRCLLPTSGNKLTMATRLHQYFCTSVNMTSADSGDVANSDNAEVPPRDARSQLHQSTETSVPHNSLISQQLTYQLLNIFRQFMPLVNSQPPSANGETNANGDEELSEAFIIQPVMPVTTSGAVTHQTSNALSMPINQSSLMNMIPTSVANPTDQLLPPVPPRIRERIIKGEYIDFAMLLLKAMFSGGSEPDCFTSFTVQLPNSTGNFSVRQTPKAKKITSFSSWMEAWNIFLAVWIDHMPS